MTEEGCFMGEISHNCIGIEGHWMNSVTGHLKEIYDSL
jgi:hypothetical protein